MATARRQTMILLASLAIGLLTATGAAAIGAGCTSGADVPSAPQPAEETSQTLARWTELNGVRLSYPSDWFSQWRPDSDMGEIILISQQDPTLINGAHVFIRGDAPPQRPQEGPWVEMTQPVRFVAPANASAITDPISGERVLVFRDFAVGPSSTTMYYVPSRNVMIKTSYTTTEEGDQVNRIIATLTIGK